MDKNPQKVQYVLTMTPETAHTVSRACEFYSRIRCGQLKEFCWEVLNICDEDFCERRDRIEPLLEEIRKIAFPELPYPEQSYGVGHDRVSDMAWNIYQAVRYKLAWTEHPQGGITVNFDKPMRFSNTPMPECVVLKDRD